ncbi:MAG: phosphotransferase [Clostridia bacterium]|nr:phosphotransferase [Clostridia bacterium]
MYLNLDNPITERKNKTVYKDGDKTIKLFIENYSKAAILKEALNQARVEEGTDLIIPKLIEVSKIDNRWALVYEHIEGKTIRELINENPEKTDEYMSRFVDIQLEVLSKKVPLLNKIKEKYKEKINSLEDLDDNTRYELQERLDGMKDHTKLCHGDFVPSNVIIKEDGSYAVIDWAHVTQGNASADAANTYMELIIAGNEDLAQKYIELFVEKSQISKILIQRWLPIVAASRKAKGVHEEQEFLDKWIDVVDYN